MTKLRRMKQSFVCPECNFAYEEKELAEKCEKWCKEYHSCNIDIIKYAISSK